jgi:hypothetical protein
MYLLPRQIDPHLMWTIASNGNYGMGFSNETYALLLLMTIGFASRRNRLFAALMVVTIGLLVPLRFDYHQLNNWFSQMKMS